MLQKLFYSLILIFLIGCTENTPQKTTTLQKVPKKKETPKKVIPQYDLITNENVVERLTKYGKENPETIADIYTSKGKIRIRLYEDTPLHRANFVLLTKKGYYNGCLFSRVAKNFMAQFGGSYDEKQKEIQKTIGVYTIPAEIKPNRFHKKGAIAAARSYTNNPEKRSAMDELYFVEGNRFSDITLDKYEKENNYKYSKAQRQYYLNNPGAAHIDGEHTVFGEIIEGYSVVPQLTHVVTDTQDWPNIDMFIDSVKLIR
ncbi:MAG: peptidylprolyl isomerase [Vicingus serpentipes]|nr:peptidylprolyl isomerase [Vicingus serpentipes]